MGGDGDYREGDGWMASSTLWTWVWISSGSWLWRGKPGVLQSMGLQRVDMTEWLKWIFISTLHCRYHYYPLFTDKKSKAQRIQVTCSRLWWVVETGFEPSQSEIRAIIIKWTDEVCVMPRRRHKQMITIYLGSEASHDPLKEKKMICWILIDHLLCGRLCFKCVHLVNPLWNTLNRRFINSFYRKSNQGSEK